MSSEERDNSFIKFKHSAMTFSTIFVFPRNTKRLFMRNDENNLIEIKRIVDIFIRHRLYVYRAGTFFN